jgi:electron transfer flavoprotein beta subunit
MEIVVCVKQVALVAARSGVDPSTGGIAPESLVHALNPHDEAAVEEALRIRERHGGRVTVVTVGPPRVESALRWCLSMGADEAVHVVGEAPWEEGPWPVSAALAEVIRPLERDLVLFGRVAIDDEMGQVGTFVAELLGLPVVTAVAGADPRPAEGKIVLRRLLERGNREVVECRLPAALTVDRCLNRPRYPTLAGRRAAERREIFRVALDGVGNPAAGRSVVPVFEVVRLAPPRIRPRKILAPDDSASAAGRMQWILSGGMKRKESGRITGSPEGLADGIVSFLEEKGFLPR